MVGTSKDSLVRVRTSRPVVPARSSLSTATWLSRFCTTYRVRPSRSRPSPLVSTYPPRSTVRATPVAGSTRNRAPVLVCTTSRARRSGVATMPLALVPAVWVQSPVNATVLNVDDGRPLRSRSTR